MHGQQTFANAEIDKLKTVLNSNKLSHPNIMKLAAFQHFFEPFRDTLEVKADFRYNSMVLCMSSVRSFNTFQSQVLLSRIVVICVLRTPACSSLMCNFMIFSLSLFVLIKFLFNSIERMLECWNKLGYNINCVSNFV